MIILLSLIHICGRLLCCLKYEDDGYKECRKCLPKVGQIIEVENGKGKVTSIDVLNKKIKIELENGNVIEEQIKNGDVYKRQKYR